MSIPTAAVTESEWNAQREALLVKENSRAAERRDEYTPAELAGGRS